MEAMAAEVAANGQGALGEKAMAAPAHSVLAGEGQERLLFFATVLIGHKVEVQVSQPG